MAICLDMFMAGSDTTNKSLSFAFLHLLRSPHVVKKAQEEMDRVVGRDRMPTLADRPKYVYKVDNTLICSIILKQWFI
jgi:cytochrome P450